MSRKAVQQMQYLELIKFVVGATAIGDYWQRLNGGDLTVANAQFKRPNRRGDTYLGGRYTISQISLERDYIPDGAYVGLMDAVLKHIQDPGESNNGITIVRVMPNSPSVGGRKTTLKYLRCTPSGIPGFTDADVTSDQGHIMNRIAFNVEDLRLEVPQKDGKTKVYDTESLLSAGWDGLASNVSQVAKK